MPYPTKWFASDMTGAPVLSGTAGSLLTMLDACLVDGFNLVTLDSLVVLGGVATANKSGHGFKQHQVVTISGATPGALNGEARVLSVTATGFTFSAAGISDQTATGTITAKTAPAGWLKPFSGTNLAAYKSADVSSSQIYARFNDTNALYATMSGFETMSDVNTGTASFGGHSFKKSDTASTAARKWVLIADGKTVYFGVAWDNTTTYDFYSFGDFSSLVLGDVYNFRVQGLLSSAPTAIGCYSSMSEANPGNYAAYSHVARAYSQLPGSVTLFQSSMAGAQYLAAQSSSQTSWPWALSGNHGAGSITLLDSYPSPAPADNGVHFFPVFLIESTGGGKLLRGAARGLLHVFETLPPVSGNYTVVTGVSNVTDGRVLMIRSAGQTYGGTFPATVLAFDLGAWS